MNSKQHRSTHRQVDQIDRRIMKEIESLRQLQRFSSKPSNRTPTHNPQAHQKPIPKIIQVKPSSKGDKSYIVSQVKVGNSNASKVQRLGYQDNIQTRKNGKENIARNPMNELIEYNKKKSNSYTKIQKDSSSLKSHLKTQTYTKQDEVDYRYDNKNHYVSANVVDHNLFENYDLSNSGGRKDYDQLFPEDSLNFSLRQQVPQEMTKSKAIDKKIKSLRQDFLDIFDVGMRKSEMKRKENERAVQCTFKPMICDKSKEMAERLGSSYTRLTKTKNTIKQNTYRQNPSRNKMYSRQRLNTLSRPRTIAVEPERDADDQCTFKPVLSKKSLNHFNGCYLDIVERNMLWENQRQQKLEKMRESSEMIKDERMRMQCSALKLRNNYNPNQQVAFSRFGKDGLIEYFERVNQVNETKKREKEAESKFSGKGWNGAVTKPQEFRLSTNSPNELSYRSRGKSVMVSSVGNNQAEREYEKAVKEVHDKIRQLNLMI